MSFKPGKVTLGFIPANRGFFSPKLAAQMRKQTIDVIKKAGVGVVVPSEKQTNIGCVENHREAEICARLFRRKNVDGIVIGAVNFGDEQAAALTVRRAALDVPVLIFGCQEEEVLTRSTARRDAFCGLLSIGEALRQVGAKYTVARRPICFPKDESFKKDLDWFARICRVVNGIRRARYGQIGARPEAFWTCRFDEKQIQRLGASTVVLDLSEAFAGANALTDGDPAVTRTLAQIKDYAQTTGVPNKSLMKMAKFEAFVRQWTSDNDIDALAIQCWTSIQTNLGICSCTAMSRLGDEGTPAACEADIVGAMSMHGCMLASGTPAALADWNNLHNEDDELANVWHCGVFPKSFAGTPPAIGAHEIIVSSGTAPRDDAMGICELVAKPSPLTLSRITQDPADGEWKAMMAHGRFEDNEAETFGSYGWCRIPDLQRLYRDVLLNHFPHHVAITQGYYADVLWEAYGKYLGFSVYHATQETPGLYAPGCPF